MGVVECVAHKLIEPFQVLYEKHSEYRFYLLIDFARINSIISSFIWEAVARHFAIRKSIELIFFLLKFLEIV
jgi:hypothetical protein